MAAPTQIAHSIPFREFMFAQQPSASSTFYENLPRDFINADNAIGTTGLLTMMAVPLLAGDTITSISVCVGATAGATLTNQYVCLYSSATIPLVLGQSTAGAAASMAANTVFTGTLATPVVVPSNGLYWAGVCVTGTTIPTLVGKVTNVNATVAAALNTLIGGNGVCVTATGNATVAPATMASITQLAVQPYVLLK